MRRSLSSLLLLFCLVFGQQGALLHALRHDFPQANAPIEGEDPHPAGMTCPACLAFAHVAGVVTSVTVPPLLLALAFHWPASQPFARRAADLPQARARDPPAFFWTRRPT